jgi:hypothetical protein
VARRDGGGGADGEVGRDVVARWEGEGKVRRGRREGPDGGAGGRRERGVARWGRGVPDGMGGVPDGDLWELDGMGGCPNGNDAGDGRGGCPNKGEG